MPPETYIFLPHMFSQRRVAANTFIARAQILEYSTNDSKISIQYGDGGVDRSSHGSIVCLIEREGMRVTRGQQRQPVLAPGGRTHGAARLEQCPNRPAAEGRNPEEIVTHYAPFCFLLIGLTHAAAALLAFQIFVIQNKEQKIRPGSKLDCYS